jgi:hypothetical protein
MEEKLTGKKNGVWPGEYSGRSNFTERKKM